VDVLDCLDRSADLHIDVTVILSKEVRIVRDKSSQLVKMWVHDCLSLNKKTESLDMHYMKKNRLNHKPSIFLS